MTIVRRNIMQNANIEVINPPRPMICKYCGQLIESISNEKFPIAIKNLQMTNISPPELWFHQDCWFNMFKESIRKCTEPVEIPDYIDSLFAGCEEVK